MVPLDRVLLGLVAVVLVLGASFLVLTIAGNGLLLHWLLSPSIRLDGGIVAVILLLLAIYLLILITRSNGRRFIVYERELGAVRISTDCIRGLITEAAKDLPGLQQVTAKITSVDEPKVKLKVQVSPDYNIPQFSEELQQHIKGYVEKTVGIVFEEVEIDVIAIASRDDSDGDLTISDSSL